MNENLIPRSVGVHDGAFHADEVTACALLLLFDLVDKKNIYRTRDQSILDRLEYVCDVGGIYDEKTKRFDHHQVEYLQDLSSAGMVLLYLKNQKILSSELYDYFNDSFIHGVDAHDIGEVHLEKGFCYFSDVIANFLPARYEAAKEEVDKAFFQALDFTIGHLRRLQQRYEYLQKCRLIVQEKMQSLSKVLIFDEPIAWQESFFALGGEKHPALFVIMPTQEHWKLRAVPPSWEKRMQMRIPLPQKWAGLHEKQLQEVSKIPGAIFCHKSRFISIWKTKQDAIKAVKIILGEENEDNF